MIVYSRRSQYRKIMADIIDGDMVLWALVVCCAGTRVVRFVMNMRSKTPEEELDEYVQ